MEYVRAFAFAIVLAAVAAPVFAQADTDLCLRVQAAPGADLADPSAVQDGIATGEILVTGVAPCGAATATAATATPVSDAGTGAWIVGPIETDPMTDERQSLAHLDAASGPSGHPVRLSVACVGGSTELTVSWPWNLGPEELIDVEMRIGDGEITTERWFNAGTTTGYGGADTAFIESLFAETRLALRLMTLDSGPATAAFDLTGIENAMANVRETCGW